MKKFGYGLLVLILVTVGPFLSGPKSRFFYFAGISNEHISLNLQVFKFIFSPRLLDFFEFLAYEKKVQKFFQT